MSPERWQQVEAALDAVLDAPPSKRGAVLDRVCHSDDALRDEVQQLLSAHDEAGSYLEAPANEVAASLLEDDAEVTAEYAPFAETRVVPPRPASRPTPAAKTNAATAAQKPPSREPALGQPRSRVFLTLGSLVLVAFALWGAIRYVAAPPERSHAQHLLTASTPLLPEGAGQTQPAGDFLRHVATRLGTATNPDDADQARLAELGSALATTLGRPSLADRMSRQAVVYWRRLQPADHLSLAAALAAHGHIVLTRGDTAAAVQRYREALQLRRAALPAGHPDVASSMNDFGVALITADPARAETLLKDALQARRARYGEIHPYVANTLSNLAVLLHRRGALDEAESLYRKALAIYERTLGTSHPRGVTISANLAALLQDQGRLEEARRIYEDALSDCRALYGEQHPQVGRLLYNLATLEHTRGAHLDAERYYEDALAVVEATLPDAHPDRHRVQTAYAHLLQADGRAEEAAVLLARAD